MEITPSELPKELRTTPEVSAWDPRCFVWMSLLFTFFPSMVMAAYNWEVLGQPERKRRLFWLAAGIFPLWLASAVLSVHPASVANSEFIFLGLNTFVGLILSSQQVRAYSQLIKNGGSIRSRRKPVLLSVVFLVGVLILLMILMLLQDMYLG